MKKWKEGYEKVVSAWARATHDSPSSRMLCDLMTTLREGNDEKVQKCAEKIRQEINARHAAIPWYEELPYNDLLSSLAWIERIQKGKES